MRLFACLVMLALVPTAAAQMPQGSLEIQTTFEATDVDAGDVVGVNVDVVYHCPTFAIDVQGDYVAFLDVKAPASLSIAGPTSVTLGEASCLQGGSHVATFPLQIAVADDENGTLEIDFEAGLDTPSYQTAPAPHDVHSTGVLVVDGPPRDGPEVQPTEEKDRPLEEEAPGPAVPLLAAGLLALARRRQA